MVHQLTAGGGAQGDLSVIPPSSNTGGKSPDPSEVHYDFVSWTYPLPPKEDPCKRLQAIFAGYLPGVRVDCIDAEKGWQGYERSYRVEMGDKVCGLVAFGGDAQAGTCYVSLSGFACQFLTPDQVQAMVGCYQGVKVTRLDIAADYTDGLSITDCVEAWRAGEFINRGRNPRARFIDDMGSGGGCTLYVGSKANGKEVCCYEKGKQMGDGGSTWVRVEGRLFAKDRVILVSTLHDPVALFRGLNPFCARIVKGGLELVRTVRLRLVKQIDHAVEVARRQYGQLVTLLEHQLGSAKSVVELLKRPGYPERVVGTVMLASFHGIRYTSPQANW